MDFEISANIDDLPDDMRQKLVRASLGEFEQRQISEGLRSVNVPGMGNIYQVDSEEGGEALERMAAEQTAIFKNIFGDLHDG